MSPITLCLYSHNGSKNHGCEAIVRGSTKILSPLGTVRLLSFNKDEDTLFGLDRCLPVEQARVKRTNGSATGKPTLRNRIKSWAKKAVPLSVIMQFQKKFGMKSYQDIAQAQGDVFVSIGGDIYCYDSYAVVDYLNEALGKRAKTVLWGCSITPARIEKDKNLRADLSRYALICARESITYNALTENGITKNTHLVPDPAFVMDPQETPLPEHFASGNTVGINLSPVVQHLAAGNNLAYENVRCLIRHILSTTDMHICLLAHVIWPGNNDLIPLTSLYEEFKHTGRVSLTGQTQNARELKYIISKCRFMVAARTHASIAAYSTQVPTLVIGYSVKARGIARDLFGQEEGYVVPVQHIRETDELTRAFTGLQAQEDAIRARYKTFMPDYIARAYRGAEEIKKLMS